MMRGAIAPLTTAPNAEYFLPVGTWLSLVEHCIRDAGVAGSNPVVPTRIRTGNQEDRLEDRFLIFSFWVKMVTKWSHFFETMSDPLFFDIESPTEYTGHSIIKSH